MSSLAGKTIQRVRLHWPAYGSWRADVETTAGTVPEGVLVPLIVGDIPLLGTVLPGSSGLDGPDAWHGVAVGAAGWRSFLSDVHASYQGDPGVKLSTVLRDLAADCGETLATTVALGAAADRSLGAHWARPFDIPTRRYRGEDALALLARQGYARPWWPDALGVTRFDARAATPILGGKARVMDRDRSIGRRTIGTDSAVLFTPGRIFENAVIARTIVTETKGELRVEVYES